MPHPIVHFEIAGKDPQKLQDYYRNLFGWSIEPVEGLDYALVDTGDGGIGGGIAQADAPTVTFSVEVADLDAYIAKAESLGGKLLMPPTEIPDMVTFALIADPEGNPIGLLKGS
jgi:uncharacterized protein